MLSVRERMEEHRKNPACNSCHRVIDPLGLALENFDVTGAWRIKDNDATVDSSGDLYDGTKMQGPQGLRNALLKHQDVFLLSFTESLMTYALGRRVEYFDMPTVRTIVRDAAKQNRLPDVGSSSRVSSTVRRSRWAGPKRTERDDRRPLGRLERGDAMYITKKHISRRTMLRGMGVTMALPFLEAMVPAGRRTPRPPPVRCGWPPSRWCTARPAPPRLARRSTCGRRRPPARRSISARAAWRRSSRTAIT
jgi:hypothetical protein